MCESNLVVSKILYGGVFNGHACFIICLVIFPIDSNEENHFFPVNKHVQHYQGIQSVYLWFQK